MFINVQQRNKTFESILMSISERLKEHLVENDMENYDGFYFIPSVDDDDEDTYKLAFFNLKEEAANGVPVDSSEMGNMYHMCFFKTTEEGAPVFDDAFEAILADPIVYVNNLTGSGLGGCILKKTDKSEKWWVDYLDYITGGEFKQKVKEAFGSLGE